MHTRRTWIEVDLDRFASNYALLKQATQKEIFCVVKANAYGHGDREIVQAAAKLGCKMMVVSSMDEAMHLRSFYRGDILVLGYTHLEDVSLAIENQITLSVTNKAWVDELLCMDLPLRKLKVHLKVDTGMNRIGMKNIQDMQKTCQNLLEHHVQLEGIYSHFHSADDPDQSLSMKQIRWFNAILDSLKVDFKYVHHQNSDAALSLSHERCNAIRVGLSLYGIACVQTPLKLQPILSLYTEVYHIKKVCKGETIGYGATYTCKEDSYIATLPIGYADGFIRRNQGRYVSIDNHPYEIVGRVCMDQCMVKVDQPYPIGTKVELISDLLPVSQMAKELGTIPYECLALLSARITRKYIEDGEIKTIVNERFDVERSL